MVFRRANSLRDRLTQSHYVTEHAVRPTRRGTYQCGHCPRCPWVLEGEYFTLPNGEEFHPPFSANCGTKGVIYLMICNCGAFYIGKTFREFRQRMGDHLYQGWRTRGSRAACGSQPK